MKFKIGDEVFHKGIKMLVRLVGNKGKFPIGCTFWDASIYDLKNRIMWFALGELVKREE